MDLNSFRAFAEPTYNYYRLKKDIGPLKAGAIFILDPNDHIRGSISCGCLKLCWTPNGDCYSGLCGSAVILHPTFADDEDLFECILFDERQIIKEKILDYITRLKNNEMEKDKALDYLYSVVKYKLFDFEEVKNYE